MKHVYEMIIMINYKNSMKINDAPIATAGENCC